MVSQENQKLQKFDMALARRVIAMTKPYWVSSGKNQKWLLAGYLVCLLIGAWGLYVAFNVATGSAISELWPAAIVQALPVSAINEHQLAFTICATILALALPTIYLWLTRRVMDTGWRLLGILISLLLAVNGLNVLLSFLNRDMINALQVKDVPEFWRALLVLGSVFIVGIPIVVCYRWVRERLGIAWRQWLTQDLLGRYLKDRRYYKISQLQSVENPDQRVSEDVRLFANGALSFVLIVLDSILTVLSFAAVLWAISPLLSGTVIVYAVVGSVVTIVFGRRLIGLNFKQEEVEANFRYQTVHVRNNAEAIAFYKGEAMESKSLHERFGEVVKNYKLLIGWQRNLAFFTQGYDYLVVALPYLVMAPLYFQEGSVVTFGDIMQASMAFGQILAALSLFVAQFQLFSGFAANVNRLSGFMSELEKDDQESARIKFESGDGITLKDVSVQTPNYERTLIEKLDVDLEIGQRLLVVGPSGSGKSSLMRVVSGLWDAGRGTVVTPNSADMFFLPQVPYLPLGSLRWQLLYPDASSKVTDAELKALLTRVNLPDLIEKFAPVGGLDAVLPWTDVLSPGERQRIAFARLLLKHPKYVVLDEATSSLDMANEDLLYSMLPDTTTLVSVGHRDSLRKYHDHILTLDTGGWRLQSITNDDGDDGSQLAPCLSTCADS